MDVTLIYKSDAGGGVMNPAAVRHAIEDTGARVKVFDKKISKVADALRHACDVVAVAGGDGTVAQVIRALPDRTIPLLVLPFGKANNIARSFGIAWDESWIARALKSPKTTSLDVFLAECGPCRLSLVEGAGLGCLRDAQNAKGGSGLGLVELRRDLAGLVYHAHPIPVTLTADGTVHQLTCVGLEILNIRRVGPALPLVPDANMGDGLLDIAILEDAAALATWIEAPDAAPAPLRRLRATSLTLESHPARRLRLDDIFLDSEDRCTLSIEPDPPSVKILT